jgi:hypothetical protein
VDSLKSIKEEEAAEATDDKFVHITFKVATEACSVLHQE